MPPKDSQSKSVLFSQTHAFDQQVTSASRDKYLDPLIQPLIPHTFIYCTPIAHQVPSWVLGIQL